MRVFIVAIAGTGLLFLTQAPCVSAQPPEIPNPDTWVTDGAVHAIETARGIIYIGGNFTHVGPNTGTGAALSAATGKPQPPYSRGNDTIYAVVPDGVGGWYIGGTFTMVQGVERGRLAHILADGTLDASWDRGADNTVFALALSGGTLYAGGECTSAGGVTRNHIAAIDAATGVATSWDPDAPNASDKVYALAVSGGAVYVRGIFSEIGGAARWNIAAIDAASGLAAQWDPVANRYVTDLAVSGGIVCAGGQFWEIGGETRNRMAAIDTATGAVTSWDPQLVEFWWGPSEEIIRVHCLALSGETVYVGGDFTTIGGEVQEYFAQFGHGPMFRAMPWLLLLLED